MLRIMQGTISIAVAIIFALTILAQPTQTQTRTAPSRDMEKERAIWQQLEKISPKSVETFKAATEAMDKGDYDQAAKLYEQVMKKAAGFDHIYRRLGTSLMLAGRADEGMPNLERAYEMNPSPENMITLAEFLDQPGEGKEGTRDNKLRALDLAKRAMAAKRNNGAEYALVVSKLAMELDDVQALREAAAELNDNHSGLMQTHFINAVLAASDEDWTKAEEEITEAQRLGLSAEAADRFLDSGVRTRARVWRYLYYSLYLIAAWIIGLALLFVLGKLFSSLTLRSIEETDPNGETGPKEISLRAWYKRLINVAGVYYYISLPVVVFLVLAVAGSILYGFLMIGWIPIKIALFVGIAAVVTIYKMVRSLFIRIQSEDPGRALRPEEAPGLWTLTREVAQRIGTRPIDEIRITPGCELAVYEKGSFREKLQDRAKRNLILGVGVLNGMRQNAFCAVLAHEYGHFSHRDTAGGDVALRVDQDMMKFAIAMAMAGQAAWWNIAFQFLRVYHFIFRRITHGATRLQEILADRVAVRNYGAESFEEGLRHVIRRDVEFSHVASREIEAASEARRDLANLYQLPEVKGTADERQVEEAVNDIIIRPTSEDDTHPSPIERFRLASRIVCNRMSPQNGMVWDLFANRQDLTSEMSRMIDEQVKNATAG